MTELSLLLQSTIATNLSNLDSKRFRNPSLETRKERWTEIWGQDDDEAGDSPSQQHWNSSVNTTIYPQLPITLFQFNPAWAEQLVLKLAKIPFVVVNSNYAATEATGALPYLRDLTSTPALVGRHHPSRHGPSTDMNDILLYLKSAHHVDLDQQLSSSQRATSLLYYNLIHHQLQPMLDTLTFEHVDAWQQVYRPRYIAATAGASAHLLFLGAWWQTWAIRAVARKSILHHHASIEMAILKARAAYTTLEATLQNESHQYLLGTKTPSTIDCLLFQHLADALCNVHLVLILADFPKLIHFFQTLYKTHFGLHVQDDVDHQDWTIWNRQENFINAFNTLPIQTKHTTTNHKDALTLMQSLSIHQHDLQEVLNVLVEQRAAQEKGQLVPQPSTPKMSMLHQWRMGGDMSGQQEEKERKETPQDKWRKDQKYSDEVWISAVLLVSAAVIGHAAFQVNK